MLALGKLLDLTLAGREPTEKIQLTADGTRLHWLAEGALEVTPIGARDNGVDLLLSAGIHGNETAPIELLERLIRKVAAGTLKPAARVLFLFGNPEAIRRGERYVEQDMNRLFNGRHEEGSGNEAFRAAELERLAQVFFSKTERVHLHYDLHTAIRGSKIEQFALYPWAEGRQHSRSELARLRDAGIEAVLLQNKPGITFSAYTYGQLGAEAFTLNWARHVRSERTRRSTWSAWAEPGAADRRQRGTAGRLPARRPQAVQRVARGDQAQRPLPPAPRRRRGQLHRTRRATCWPRISAARAGWWTRSARASSSPIHG